MVNKIFDTIWYYISSLLRIVYLLGYLYIVIILFWAYHESKESILFSCFLFSTSGLIYTVVYFINRFKTQTNMKDYLITYNGGSTVTITDIDADHAKATLKSVVTNVTVINSCVPLKKGNKNNPRLTPVRNV